MLYVLFMQRRPAPRDRRRVAPHLRWRELRWPSFITWRWAGPARAGWIRCQWRTRRPPVPPRRRLHTTISTRHRQVPAAGPRSLDANQPRNRPRNPAEAPPESLPPERALNALARSRPKRAPESPRRNPRRRAGAGRPGRAHARARAGNLPAEKAPGGHPPGRARRRVGAAGGGKPLSSAFPGGPAPPHN
jgi:hypothetical protein